MTLSKYFKWEETEIHGDDEPARLRAYLLATFVLDPMREVFGPLLVNSWYRTWAKHEDIYTKHYPGRRPPQSSLHLYGLAADVKSIEGHAPELMASWLWQHRSTLPLGEVEIGRSHLHVAAFDPVLPFASRLGPDNFLIDTPDGVKGWTP